MPTSLLQLDVAIEMLRYIIPEETVDEILKKKKCRETDLVQFVLGF